VLGLDHLDWAAQLQQPELPAQQHKRDQLVEAVVALLVVGGVVLVVVVVEGMEGNSDWLARHLDPTEAS